MLDFADSLFVGSFLEVLMFSVASGEGLSIPRSMWVEDPNVEKGTFETTPPETTTSSLAPSSIMAEAPESASPVIGCRVGSVHTSCQTSVIRFAVRSRTSLCRMVGKPPIGHDSACSTEKLVPQAHEVGVCKGCQPYLRAMASLKAPLWRVRPNSSRGREVSQLEAMAH